MKSLRGILAFLLILVLSASTALAANTIVLRHGATNTTEATLAAAIAAAVSGDTVDITAYDTPINGGAGFQLIGVSLICSAAGPAEIDFPVPQTTYYNYTYILAQGAVTLSNIKFVGSNQDGGSAVIAFDAITIDKCSFFNFAASAVWILNVDSFDAGGTGFHSTTLNAHITNTYASSTAGSAIQISSLAVGGGAVLPGTITLDHDTLAATWSVIEFDTTYLDGEPTHDFSPMHVTNTLFYSAPIHGSAFFVQDVGTYTGASIAGVNWHEDHNAFIAVGGDAADIIGYQVSSLTDKEPTLASSDIFQDYLTADPFVDDATGNFKLALSSTLFGKGSAGTNIGADQTAGPVVPHGQTSIVITHNGGTIRYSDMPTAAAAMLTGDTMDIQNFTGPLLWGPNNTAVPGCPAWCTVKCTSTTQATILIPSGNSGNNMFCSLDHMTLQNLIVDGQCVGSTHNAPDGHAGSACMINGGDVSTVTNCTFKGCWWNTIMLANGNMSGGVQEAGTTFTDCYIEGYGCALAFTDNYVTAPATITDKAIFNHCTIVNPSGFPINLDADYDGKDYKDVFSMRNSIVSGRGSGVCIVYAGAGMTDPATQVDEDYNVFDTNWNPLYGQGGGYQGPPVSAHSVKVNILGGDPEFFTNFTAGDYSLNNASGNPCVGTASDHTNIGAFQFSGPPNAAKSWTFFN